MFELEQLEAEDIATALADQTDCERRWPIDPRTGKLEFWTSDLGIDGQKPVDVDGHRAVEWLAGNSFVDEETAERYLREHPDPELP
jgi:hypothetical protein